MIPIADDNRDRAKLPFVTWALIIVNILVYIVYQEWGTNTSFTFSFATIPAEIITGEDFVTAPVLIKNPLSGQLEEMPGLGVTPIPVWLTLITSMFMHGGLAHLGGNMLYLWIFGDNMEDRMGHLGYFLFYIVCGILASLTHVSTEILFGQNPLTPSIGASGAISAVMGAYLITFPTRRVTVFFLFFFFGVPAFVVLGLWIVLQVANGTGYLGGSEAAGIAYAAHIGGFFAGMFLLRFFKQKPKQESINFFGKSRRR